VRDDRKVSTNHFRVSSVTRRFRSDLYSLASPENPTSMRPAGHCTIKCLPASRSAGSPLLVSNRSETMTVSGPLQATIISVTAKQYHVGGGPSHLLPPSLLHGRLRLPVTWCRRWVGPAPPLREANAHLRAYLCGLITRTIAALRGWQPERPYRWNQGGRHLRPSSTATNELAQLYSGEVQQRQPSQSP
jgi:hypothetical protein